MLRHVALTRFSDEHAPIRIDLPLDWDAQEALIANTRADITAAGRAVLAYNLQHDECPGCGALVDQGVMHA